MSPDTWRYRLWQWLRTNNIDFELVGPYQGTHKPTPPPSPRSSSSEEWEDISTPEENPDSSPTSPASPRLISPEDPVELSMLGDEAESSPTPGSYAPDVEPEFVTTCHFSRWGYQTHQAKSAIASQISTYQPDYLLVLLGFNDLGWFVNGPDGLLADMRELVCEARSVKSNVKFAIADVPQRKRLEGRQDLIDGTEEYNRKLVEAIEGWDSEESPVRLVRLCKDYGCKSCLFLFLFLLRRVVNCRK
jgi:hypothetical protein